MYTEKSLREAETSEDVIAALRRGEDINGNDKDAWEDSDDEGDDGPMYPSPLCCACENGYYDVVDTLLKNGVDPDECGNSFMGPIQIAARNGHVDIVKRLVESGIDVDDHNICTPLYCACENGHMDVIEFLIASGAEIDYPFNDIFCNKTALMGACENGYYDVVNYLIKNGADINIMTESGVTAFSITCASGETEIFDTLIDHGVNLEQEHNKSMNHPMSQAAYGGHIEIIIKLLDLNFDINNTKSSSTPLMRAILGKQKDVVEFLLKNGANVNIVSDSGKTAFDFAESQPEILALLQKYSQC